MVPGITHLFVQNYMEYCLNIYIINTRTDRYKLNPNENMSIRNGWKYNMFAPIKTNASVVKFDGSGHPPPLLPSSQYDGCSFSRASIEHMILYLSVLAFLINTANTFPCNFLQIYVLYQDHLSSIMNFICPYHILIVRVLQLSITYQHGVAFYSTQKLWLYLGMWYSNYPHLSLFCFHNYYTL